jgi:ABC-type transport system involved in cytochrome c biogenesis permease subunit
MLMRIEALANAGDRESFTAVAEELNAGLTALAEVRGEYGKIPLEVRFYGYDFFTKALGAFLLSFLLVAFSWLAPRARWLVQGATATSILGLALVVAGVTLRCIIRSRPPVSTLYETILFIAGCAVLVSLVIEFINRERIALAITPVLGALGMFLAMKYELKEAVTSGDTMPSLVAVLDTNFWLSTHVTTVTLGYAAGLLSAAIAHVFLIGRLIGLRRNDRAFYKKVARMAYGVLCFGLLFSIVGTILGGIWANYSWGRFWGWDPKENGALLIVLWELMVLHLRMGGYVRDFGLCMLCLLGGLVVAFSWWGVNLLGVGLHSYGFTSGVMQILATFYLIEVGLAAAAGLWWFAQHRRTPRALETAP